MAVVEMIFGGFCLKSDCHLREDGLAGRAKGRKKCWLYNDEVTPHTVGAKCLENVSSDFLRKKICNFLFDRNTFYRIEDHERDFFPPISILIKCCCHKITEKINFGRKIKSSSRPN